MSTMGQFLQSILFALALHTTTIWVAGDVLSDLKTSGFQVVGPTDGNFLGDSQPCTFPGAYIELETDQYSR